MAEAEERRFSPEPDCQDEPTLRSQLMRLHQFTVYGRWLVVALLWLMLAPPALWALRSEFRLWRDYFTWTAVRFAIVYHPIAAIALSLCIGTTVAVLLWQSQIILFGLSRQQRQGLQEKLFQIKQQGPGHPLWRWVFGSSRETKNYSDRHSG